MPSIRDLYTYYLTAEHLQGRSVVVHIANCQVEQVFNPRAKRTEAKLLIRFHGKKLALACNKTQAASLARLTGSEDYTCWPGHTVTLSPGQADSGQETILITGAPATPATTPTDEATEPTPADNDAGATTSPAAPPQRTHVPSDVSSRLSK